MYCTNCGKELPQGAAFCPGCGGAIQGNAAPPPAPAKSATLNTKTLLIIAGAVIVILLAVLIFRPGQSAGQPQGFGQSAEAPQAPSQPQADEAPAPTAQADPAAALVGPWTNGDGVGLTFTSDGVLRLSGGGLSLGGDTFRYEVTGDNTLTLTTEASLVSLDLEAPFYLLDDTLFIEIGDYSFTLTKR